MLDSILPLSIKVRDAIVDDTLRLWIAFDAGIWLWVDIAGYVEAQASPLSTPLIASQKGMDLELSPELLLPLPLLLQSGMSGLEVGICICCIRRSFEFWYRPLRLTGRLSGKQKQRNIHQLAEALGVATVEIEQAACAHVVPLAVFLRRLNDLCNLIAVSSPSAANVFHASWKPIATDAESPTLWQAITRGQIGLAEQVIVGQAMRRALHTSQPISTVHRQLG